MVHVHPALPVVYLSVKNEWEKSVTEIGREGGRGGERGSGREGRGGEAREEGEQRYTKNYSPGGQTDYLSGGVYKKEQNHFERWDMKQEADPESKRESSLVCADEKIPSDKFWDILEKYCVM